MHSECMHRNQIYAEISIFMFIKHEFVGLAQIYEY